MGPVIQMMRRGSGWEMVRGTVEETLNAMLDAEADRLCGAGRSERNEARRILGLAAMTARCRPAPARSI